MIRLCILIILLRVASLAYAQIVDINVDCAQVIGKIRSLQGMNAGPMAHYPLWPDLIAQYQEIGVDYVRTSGVIRWTMDTVRTLPWDIHFIFPDSLADPNNPSNYNFAPADSQIQAIIETGAKPFIRLGYSWLGQLPAVRYIRPEYRRTWAEICKHIIMHYNDGWANGFNYNIEYFEIWNEPNNFSFWAGTQLEYFQLYDTTARVLKTYNPNLKIGGPATAGVGINWIAGLLIYCYNHNVPIDFVSWHVYSDTVSIDAYKVVRSSMRVQQVLDSLNFSIPHYLTEWNISASNPGRYGYNTRGGAFTASFLIYMQNTTIDKAFRYRGPEADTSFGTWFYDGTYKKPAYAFLAFKKALETPIRLHCTGSDTLGYATIAGKSAGGDTISILISDVKSSNSGYNLTVRNLPWGYSGFTYQRYLLDSLHNLELVETGNYFDSTFATQETMIAPSVQFIRLIKRQPTSVSEKPTNGTASYELYQNYPNPFNPATTIRFSLPQRSHVTLKVFDVLGREVATLVDGELNAGEHSVVYDAKDLPSGLYFYRLSSSHGTCVKSALLLK